MLRTCKIYSLSNVQVYNAVYHHGGTSVNLQMTKSEANKVCITCPKWHSRANIWTQASGTPEPSFTRFLYPFSNTDPRAVPRNWYFPLPRPELPLTIPSQNLDHPPSSPLLLPIDLSISHPCCISAAMSLWWGTLPHNLLTSHLYGPGTYLSLQLWVHFSDDGVNVSLPHQPLSSLRGRSFYFWLRIMALKPANS